MAAITVRNPHGSESRLVVLLHDAGEPCHVTTVGGPPVFAVLNRFGRWTGVLLDGPAQRSVTFDVARSSDRTQGVSPSAARFVPVITTRSMPLPPNHRRPLGFARIAREDSTKLREVLAADSSMSQAIALAAVPCRFRVESMRSAEHLSIADVRPDDSVGALAVQASMWWHLDVNTHRDLLAAREHEITWPEQVNVPGVRQARSDAITRVLTWLSARAEQRRLLGSLDPSEMEASTLPAGFHYVASLVRRVIAGWHGWTADDMRSSSFCDACHNFACGRLELLVEPATPDGCDEVKSLRDITSRAQPDSINPIFFAELALAAMNADVDYDWWSSVLRPFVSMLELFRCGYGDPAGRPWEARCYDDGCDRRPRAIRARPIRAPKPSARAAEAVPIGPDPSPEPNWVWIDRVLALKDDNDVATEFAAQLGRLLSGPLFELRAR